MSSVSITSLNLTKLHAISPEASQNHIVEQQITEAFFHASLSIFQDSQNRLEKSQEQPELLESGIFYPNEHYEVLKKILPILETRLGDLQKATQAALNNLKADNNNLVFQEAARVALKANVDGKARYERLSQLFFKLKEGGHYFHGWINPDYFKSVPSDSSVTGFSPYLFNVKKQVLPTEALDAFYTGLTLTDCLITLAAAEYTALRTIWGDEKFNAVFALDSSTPLLFYSQRLSPHPLKIFEIQLEHTPISRGCIYYMENIKDYQLKHYNGEAQGFNLICLSDQPDNPLFIGFGLPTTGVTLDQVKDRLVEEYNKSPIGLNILPQRLHPRLSLKESESQARRQHKISKKRFSQKLRDAHISFNLQRIQKIATTPLSEIRPLIDKWK